ncbi:MAG: DIP1984 family protein [Clostridia bacterium]|jgi:hypothetical protein|nr:DIP1984 family protein [Clostridia bacterium]
MKLAEALQERADLKRNISDLSDRLERVALVQEGEKPVEDPKTLLKALDESVNRMEYLMAAINHTNDVTMADGMTLTALIARKDALMLRQSVYKKLAQEAGYNTSRARGTEIKVMPAVKVTEIQKEVDRMAKEVRTLDNLLQETNWTKDLIE